jgi:gliding motility-associated lipoprotein GldH
MPHPVINKKNSQLGGIVALLLLFLVACHPGSTFESYVTVPETGWHKDSMATFQVDIDNTTEYYDLFVNIRNKSNYPNSNLWLFIDITAPSGLVVRDTINCLLANERGKWLGSGWGSLYLVEQPYQRNVKFAEAGTYRFNIIQGMRYDDLAGIHNIGLRIRKSKNQN